MTTQFELSKINQPVWDAFKAERLNQIYAKQEEKGAKNQQSAMINIAQYHEAAICLDSLCDNWNNLTLSQVERAKELKPAKVNHINGMIIYLYINRLVVINRDVAVSVIPIEYRQLVKMILE